MKCSVCGSDNLEGSAYCEDCGSRLTMTPAAPVMAAPPVPVSAPAPQVAVPVAPPVEAVPVVAPVPVAVVAPAPQVVVAPSAGVTCAVCGAVNAEGSMFCEDCGVGLASSAPVMSVESAVPQPVVAPAPQVVSQPVVGTGATCVACGTVNAAGSMFCEDCGASLSAPAPVSGQPQAVPIAPVPVAAAPVPVTANPRLVVAGSTVEFPLTKDEILLGRNSPGDGIFPEIDLTDVDSEFYVSRRHGRIVRQDGAFLYEDIGSSNGSFINGNKLVPKMVIELHNGDTLRLGRTEMCFRM